MKKWMICLVLLTGIQSAIASDIREICCDLDALHDSLSRQLYGLGSWYGIDHDRPTVETPEVTSAVDLAHIQADDTPSYNAGMEQSQCSANTSKLKTRLRNC